MDMQEILVVDDEPIQLSILQNLLSPHFRVRVCNSGEDALAVVERGPRPDLILLDILLPGIDGYTTLEAIKENPANRDIQVVFCSGLDREIHEEKGFLLGASDYIKKPYRPAALLERVRLLLDVARARDILKDQNEWLEDAVERRIKENLTIQEVLLNVVTQLAETRDLETGNHILRTRSYIGALARGMQTLPDPALEMDDHTVELIVKASPLHDIGKIGIPDSILNKPGELTTDEFDIMKTHCRIGAQTIRTAIEKVHRDKTSRLGTNKPDSLTLLEFAETIALTHHEKWDGTGYPEGLKGEKIPLLGRLMAVADVFDTLTTPRKYKQAWSFKNAADYIIGQRGIHFDPAVVDVFAGELVLFESVMLQMADTRA